MSTDPDLRLIRIRGEHAMSDAMCADVCQLTISRTVDSQPEVIDDHDGREKATPLISTAMTQCPAWPAGRPASTALAIWR